MPTWHIVDRRHLQKLVHIRRLYALLLVAFGIGAGVMLARSDGGIATAQAAGATLAFQTQPRSWCDAGNGLRMSCGLTASKAADSVARPR
ncbi:MAG TPA: hypothetical protein VGE57_12355 [Solimonas sp.]